MRWIVAYDIHSPRVRRRTANRLLQWGFRRQLSVFEGEGSLRLVERLLDELAPALDPQRDSLVAWSREAPHQLARGRPLDPMSGDWFSL